MPRPEVDKECLVKINTVMEESKKMLGTIAKNMTLEMLQQNAELTNCITGASISFAKVFCKKLNIKPTPETLRELVNDIVFIGGITPVIEELIKADKEARND